MSVPLRAVQRLAADPAQNSEMPSAHSISPQCHLMAYAGEQPAWVTRLSQLIAHATAIPCTVIGTSAKPGDNHSSCWAAWAYDASRKRIAQSLKPGGTALCPPTGLAPALCVVLTDDSVADCADVLTLRAGGRPAGDLQRSLEAAMIAGRGELEVEAVWRQGTSSMTVSWRCALVEWSIAVSMDRVVDKLLGLADYCLSGNAISLTPEMPQPSPIDVFPAKAPFGPLATSLQQTARRLTSKNQWAISIYQDLAPDALWPEKEGIHLVPPVDRFWADPFLARDGERLWVFFEELAYVAPKGKLRCLSIDAGGQIGKPFDVLEEGCHLSYPNVFRFDDHWYMLPESSERRDLILYRARRFPNDWEPVAQLLTNVRVVDATLHRDNGTWWLMAGSADSPGGAFDDTLHVYRAAALTGPWIASPRNAVRSDPSCSRPAGPLFRWKGQWVRPVQDCRGRYGRALHLLALASIDDSGPHEQLLATVCGDERAGVTCTHTYSRVGNDLAVDWMRWRPRWGGRAKPPALRFTAYGHAG